MYVRYEKLVKQERVLVIVITIVLSAGKSLIDEDKSGVKPQVLLLPSGPGAR